MIQTIDGIERDLTYLNKHKTHSICYNTCVIVSHKRKHEFGYTIKNVTEKVLKPSISGYVRINAWTHINVRKKYKEVFNEEWEEPNDN